MPCQRASMVAFSKRKSAASQRCSFLDCSCVTSCSLDISSNTGRHQQTDSSRNGTSSAGERRKSRVTGACTAWRSTPGWRQTPSAERLSGPLGLNGEMTFNNLLCHSETDSRNHFYNSNSVVFFFFYSGAAQTLTAGLILRFDDEARLWSVSMGSLKNGAGKTAPSDSSSGLVPECCRQTHKWHMMIINTPIRHLLRFRGCLENNVFTIKRRAQMSKEAHIIPLNGRRSTGRRTRVRRVDQSPVIVL